MSKLIDRIPKEYKNKLPASIYFAEKRNVVIKVNSLHYAKSKLYNTDKMRCYLYYKPSFL